MRKPTRNEYQAAREQLIAALQVGQSWQAVSKGPDVPLKRAMAYRLLRAVRTKGEIALQDGRHGHPSKLRGEPRAFLEVACREVPCTPSPILQATLQERFDLQVSVSQINRVRATLGVSVNVGIPWWRILIILWRRECVAFSLAKPFNQPAKLFLRQMESEGSADIASQNYQNSPPRNSNIYSVSNHSKRSLHEKKRENQKLLHHRQSGKKE